MDAKVLYASAHQPLEKQLAASLQGASKVQIAVAFLTRFGVDFIRRNICQLGHAQWQLVTSVRWPTDLEALCQLAKDYPGNIWLHIGGKTPEEAQGERYQLHSKLVLSTDTNGRTDIFIGSHNWTGMALQGLNLEIGVQIRCLVNEEASISAISHWQECQRESELFVPDRIAFYKMVQARLHHNIPIVNEDFPDFQPDRRLVIHAEAENEAIRQLEPLQLTFSPEGYGVDSVIRYGLPLDLYLYPPKSLFGGGAIEGDVVRYEGSVVLLNDNTDAPVEQRAVNTEIQNLALPTVSRLMSIEYSRRNRLQIVATLTHARTQAMPVFHIGKSPKIRQEINYERFVPPWAIPHFPHEVHYQYLTEQSVDRYGRPVITVPSNMEEEVELIVPRSEFYDPPPDKRLQQRQGASNAIESRRTHYIIKDKPLNQNSWETRYFYLVSHRETSHF